MIRLVPIDSIQIEGRHRTDLGDVAALADSIETTGLLHPPVVTPDLRLVAGERRLEALRKLGRERVEVRVVEGLDDAAGLLVAERDENTCRKAMNASELYALGKALEELERPKARARQEAQDFGRNSGSADPELGPPGRTYEVVAPAVGMSAPQWKRLKHIGDRATEGDEAAADTLDRIDRGEESVAGGYRKLRQRGITDAPDVRPTRTRLDAETRAQQIRALAELGNRAAQIADELGIGEPRVRDLARTHGITLPDAAIGKSRRHDSNRIVAETVATVEGLALGLALVDHADLDLTKVEEWATSLSDSLAPLKKLTKTLKEMARDQG